MDTLTPHRMLLPIFPASSFADDFEICILGHMFGSCIGSVAVKLLVSALLLCARNVRICCSTRQSAGI